METQIIAFNTIMMQQQMILGLQVGLQTHRVQRNFWCEIQLPHHPKINFF
jgi:hypothetical protein